MRLLTESIRVQLCSNAEAIAKQMLFSRLKLQHRSVRKVEKILGKLHKNHLKSGNEEGFNGIALIFSAYITAIIQAQTEPGQWAYHHPRLGELTYPFYWRGQPLFVHSWCNKRCMKDRVKIVGRNIKFRF